ncbi:MAG: phospholipase D-like domain-containing protein [Spirochaetia bacterium]|jgi:HKD family nuclease|nr:phospholipase D-like domain-containing protein [Spirochaetia bacterium]
MVEREFLTNSNEASMATVLKRELDNSEECIIISAFISTGLHNMLIGQLETAVASGKEIKILTSTMNNFNSPIVLQSFQTIVNQLKIFGAPGKNEAFHVKSYLFSNKYSDKTNVIIIGSSNFTQQ